MKKKLMFVVNVDWFFMSHRLPIALAAIQQGYEVHIATGITTQQGAMERHGLVVHPISLHRSSTNLIGIFNTFAQIFSVFRKVQPDLVHLVTLKPVLLGGIAARIAGVPAVVAAISGLGYVFIGRDFASRMRRLAVAALYRIALGHRNVKVIFQNSDDREILMKLTDLHPSNVEMIQGSGVDLNVFHHSPLPQGTPIVLMASRLLADKGVREFVGAARKLKDKNRVRFCLVGDIDSANPSSISESELGEWIAKGVIEYWGHRTDMANVLAMASIVVLPSYREGLPKVLLEAAAVGRPVVTTNVPGCRDAIEPDITGALVTVRDVSALSSTIDKLLSDKQLCIKMGCAARTLAEKKFGIDNVVLQHLKIYSAITSA